MDKACLILDIDGTLLFAEERPGALLVPGRRRHSYMARETIEALKRLQNNWRLILATGRSGQSTKMIVEALSREGVYVDGAVAENGGIWIGSDRESCVFVDPLWIEQAKDMEIEWAGIAQSEFETCVALIKPDAGDIALLDAATTERALPHRRLRDGNKLFILAPDIDKKNALHCQLGEATLKRAWGVGNDFNDIDWIREVGQAAAPACAKDELLKAVREQNGIIASCGGHEGIAEILSALV